MTTRELTPLEAELLAALKEAENALVDYIQTIEQAGTASLYYGRSVVSKARAAIARAETPPKGGE